MRKILLITGIISILTLAGCADSRDKAESSEMVSMQDEMMRNMEKFLHNGDTYSPELFVEMADTYEGILKGKNQQSYVFDLRSKEDYAKGHITGAVNVEFTPEDAENFVSIIPSDWAVYIIGDDEAEAKIMRDSLKAADGQLFAYIIEGGYDALIKADGIERYIINN